MVGWLSGCLVVGWLVDEGAYPTTSSTPGPSISPVPSVPPSAAPEIVYWHCDDDPKCCAEQGDECVCYAQAQFGCNGMEWKGKDPMWTDWYNISGSTTCNTANL